MPTPWLLFSSPSSNFCEAFKLVLVRWGLGVGRGLSKYQGEPPAIPKMSSVTQNHSNLPQNRPRWNKMSTRTRREQPQHATTMMTWQPTKQMTMAKTSIGTHHDEEMHSWRRRDDLSPPCDHKHEHEMDCIQTTKNDDNDESLWWAILENLN